MVVGCKCTVDWQEISDTLVRQEFSLQFRSRLKKGKGKIVFAYFSKTTGA